MLGFITNYIEELQATLSRLRVEQIEEAIRAALDARERDAQIFVIGNGGSAATASHMAVDIGKGASLGASRRYRVMSLTDNVAWMSALSNDISYADVFVEQLKNFARPGDLLLAFSGSGNSENIVRAVRYARSIGCRTIGFAGFEGGRLSDEAETCLVVDSNHMGRIEDAHLIVQHILSYYLMDVTEQEARVGPSATESAPPLFSGPTAR